MARRFDSLTSHDMDLNVTKTSHPPIASQTPLTPPVDLDAMMETADAHARDEAVRKDLFFSQLRQEFFDYAVKHIDRNFRNFTDADACILGDSLFTKYGLAASWAFGLDKSGKMPKQQKLLSTLRAVIYACLKRDDIVKTVAQLNKLGMNGFAAEVKATQFMPPCQAPAAPKPPAPEFKATLGELHPEIKAKNDRKLALAAKRKAKK